MTRATECRLVEKKENLSNWGRIIRKGEKVCNTVCVDGKGNGKRKVRKINGRGFKAQYNETYSLFLMVFLKREITLARLTPVTL